MTRHINSQQEKRTCQIVDIAVLVDHRVKIKKRKKRDKYLDLAWELKKLWNMKVMVIWIVIVVLGIIPKGFKKKKCSYDSSFVKKNLQVGSKMK